MDTSQTSIIDSNYSRFIHQQSYTISWSDRNVSVLEGLLA